MKQNLSETLNTKAIAEILKKVQQGKTLSAGEIKRLEAYENKQKREKFIEESARLSQELIIEIIDSSRKMMMEWERQGLPRNPDKTYNLFAVIQWLKNKWLHRYDDDPDMSGSDSPALEQYRAAKARLAELDLQERTRNLVDRAHTVKCMLEFGAVIRSCGADLERKHGAAARERLDQAIDAAVAAVKKMLGENEPNA